MAAPTAQPELQQPTTLVKQLAATGRKAHDVSNAIVQSRLVVLFTDRALYGRALGCFYLVYKALEDALQSVQDHPDIKRVWGPVTALRRQEGFEADLAYLLGPKWRDVVLPAPPAVKRYAARLAELAATDPRMLLVHSYTQHMGMATGGGQIIRRMARKQLGLPPDQGTKCFEYSVPVPSSLTDAFKAALNELGEGLSEAERGAMLEEHVAAFASNNAVMKEFRLGWLPFFRGLVLLLPPVSRVALLCGAAVLVAGAVARARVAPGVQ